MTVTQIEAVAGGKTKYRVFLDGQPAFVLYKGELFRYHIREGAVLEETVLTQIEEVIRKRARLRAMHLLNAMERTESQLRSKLEEGGYPKEAVQDALDYVKSFGYVNDEDYARRFAENRKKSKSRREIQSLLLQKGLSREEVESALEEVYGQEDTLDAIRRLAKKRHYDPATATSKEKQKLCAYLTRKGFRYEDIRQVIQVPDWNA